MIALRPSLPALTFFSARQLFEAAMQFFDLPTHVVRVLSDLRGQSLCWAVGNHQSMSPSGATSSQSN